MNDDDELQQKAQVMLAVVGNLAQTAQALVPMIDLYEQGRERMESVGPVLAPGLYLNEERGKADEIVWPVLKAVRDLARAYEAATVSFEVATGKGHRQ